MIPLTHHRPNSIVIVGPTAVGKTALSIDLAQAVGGEVVSADSRQVYRGLDIGSGKVTTEEMRGVPHHLLDVCDPREVFSAANYVHLGRKAVEDILARGNVPLIVGGTGFYIDALLGRVSLADVPENTTLRTRLKEKTLEELQKTLQRLDPVRFDTIDTHNPVRLIRAIEIATALGTHPTPTQETLYNTLWLGLTIPQDALHTNIETRLHARLDAGMLEEAAHLHNGGLSYERMITLGLEYRFMALHLRGDISYDNMREQLKSEIIKYAKRQMTWFKRNKAIHWIAPTDTDTASNLAKQFLE